MNGKERSIRKQNHRFQHNDDDDEDFGSLIDGMMDQCIV